VVLGLCQADRDARKTAYGHEQIATDERGVFTFVNVTPGEDYLLYGLMSGMGDRGAIDTTRVTVSRDARIVHVPFLEVATSHRIRGSVTLSDSMAMPANTRIVIGREGVFDALTLVLAPDGRFE